MTDTTSTSPWATSAPVASVGVPTGDVTLVEGQSFCIADRAGDIAGPGPQGVFVLDIRVLSHFELRLNGHRVESVAVAQPEPFMATFATRAAPAPGLADAELVVFRTRHVGGGLRERIAVTNHALTPQAVTLELLCDADFADIFEVKESRARPREREHVVRKDELRIASIDAPVPREVVIAASPTAEVGPGRISWQVLLDPRQRFEACVEVTVRSGGEDLEPRFRCGDDHDEGTTPRRRLAEWKARLPVVSSDNDDLDTAILTAGQDLGALRIFDPEHPDLPIVAAGAPWFMTVFGRDSLLTGWMTLLADPSLAQGVLLTLARFQGKDVNPETEEEPGKILHEMRFNAARGLTLRSADVYYGSIDATPLFVILVGEWARWGLSRDLVEQLLPHVDRAMEWIEKFGDRDGDGYVEYQRSSPAGLFNQGWKDSWDSIRFADGRLAEPPIALCEVQGYVYAAYLARAHFALDAGQPDVQAYYAAKAAELRKRFNEDFWLEEQGTYALALDGNKRPVDAVASNVGHCLWTGIVDPVRAAVVAERLMQPDLFCGWGVRTLSTEMAAYNPVSYHNGSVWPHDNAICAAGLERYGLIEHAHRIIEGQLAAARANGDRLPELFAGFSRDELAVPGSYPASCSPQAWSAASPLLWLRTLLRLNPWVPKGKAWVAPALPPSVGRLHVKGLTLGPTTLDILAEGDDVTITASDSELEIITEPRPPLTSLLAAMSS